MRPAKSSSSSRRGSKGKRSADFAGRYRRFCRELEKRGVDGFLVTHAPNLFHLFNIQPSAGYGLCLNGTTRLLVDGRYIEQAESEAVNCVPIRAEDSLEETLRAALDFPGKSSRRPKLGVESRHISLATARLIESWQTGCDVVPMEDVIETLRLVKEPQEIDTLEEAFRIAQLAFAATQETIRPGASELEVAGRFELELRNRGGEKAAFETIVASGPRSSMPHARASRRTIGAEEMVLVDFGVQAFGYCSDLTRMHFTPGSRKPDIFDVVAEAQRAAIDAVRPGVVSCEVDAAARSVIARHGYGDYFSHSTGHGLGLEVHEAPLISWRAPQVLEQGMVFTIEPGIYLPGQHGVRIEDAVVVTSSGCRLLSDTAR